MDVEWMSEEALDKLGNLEFCVDFFFLEYCLRGYDSLFYDILFYGFVFIPLALEGVCWKWLA
jgi:hypothetical protein